MFARDVAVLLADGERRRNGDIRHLIFSKHALNERLCGLDVLDALADVEMLHRAACVERLQLVLKVAAFEHVVRVADRKLRGIGVHRLVYAALDDAGELFVVDLRETITRSLGGCCFQIVAVPCLLLELDHQRTQIIHDLKRELESFRTSNVLADEIEAAFVHAHESDGVKVVCPVFAGALLDVSKVVGRIWIQALLGLFLNDLAFDFEADFAEGCDTVEPLIEVFLRLGEVADARQIDAVHANTAGHGVAAEEAAAALSQLALVEPETAAHGNRILRRQVGVDIVREIRDAVFAGDSHEIVHDRARPVEVLRDVDRRNRECEHTAFRVSIEHDLAKRAIEEIHLLLEIAVGLLHHLAADQHRLIFQRGWHLDVERQV